MSLEANVDIINLRDESVPLMDGLPLHIHEISSEDVDRMVSAIRATLFTSLDLTSEEQGHFLHESLKENIKRMLQSRLGFSAEESRRIVTILIGDFYLESEYIYGNNKSAQERLDAGALLLHVQGDEEDLRTCADLVACRGDPETLAIFREYLTPQEFRELALQAAYNIVHIESEVLLDEYDQNPDPASRIQPEELLARAAQCVQHAIGTVDMALVRMLVDRMSYSIPMNHRAMEGISKALHERNTAYFQAHGVPLGEEEPIEDYREVFDALSFSEEKDKCFTNAHIAFENRFFLE